MKNIAEVEMCQTTGKWCVRIEGCFERFYLEIKDSHIRLADAVNRAHTDYPDEDAPKF